MSRGEGRRAVAVGGGSGIPATIGALLALGFSTSAVVAMADNGGSTGILREHVGVLPPGDIRNCLVAMAEDPTSLMARSFQYRLPHAAGLAQHALGNLILTTFAQVTGSFPEAIAAAEVLLEARGHVYPSTLDDIHLHAKDRDGQELAGQAVVSGGTRAIERVWTHPEHAAGYPPALAALRDADLIVLGPGSLYTSVIPNLLVDGVIEAIMDSHACVVVVCNAANLQGETRDLDAADHIQALRDHGLAGRIDAVLVHDSADLWDDSHNGGRVRFDEDVRARIEALGAQVFVADLIDPSDPVRHSRARLADALEKVFDSCRSPQR